LSNTNITHHTTLKNRYLLDKEIGQGGMSVVYHAQDLLLKREVAVKILHPYLAQRKEAKARFYREAKIIAQLDHPHIVKIFDYADEQETQAFIVMEYIQGPTLSAFCKQHPIIVPEIALVITLIITQALEHAHQKGIIHRDLKPENMMIQTGGILKLMDFGIAHVLQDESLTMTGALLGSPAHMAPEMIEGKACDERSDLFSLGTILYWLVTHQLPFSAPHAQALFKKIVDSTFVNPQDLQPLVSTSIQSIIIRLLQKDPSKRYQRASELTQDIKHLLHPYATQFLAQELINQFFIEPTQYQQCVAQLVCQRLQTQTDIFLKAKQFNQALDTLNCAMLLKPEEASLAQKANLILLQKKAYGRGVLYFKISIVGTCLIGFLIEYHLWISPLNHHRTKAHVAVQNSLPPKNVIYFLGKTYNTKDTTQDTINNKNVTSKNTNIVHTENTIKNSDATTQLQEVDIRIIPFGDLWIDNQLVVRDLQKPLLIQLERGLHTIQASNRFRASVSKTIDITEKTQSPIVIKLEQFLPAFIKVIAPAGVQVEIAGEIKGQAELSNQQPFKVSMAEGERQVIIKLTKAGLPTHVDTITIRAGQTTEYRMK